MPLFDWRTGNEKAVDELMPLVYTTLHGLARRHMHSERPDHTLQTTALVHEAYERMVDMNVNWQDRAHFLAVASRLMRRILVDHAKARQRVKRGGDVKNITLDETLLLSPGPNPDLLALDKALARLSKFDERKSRVVEMHLFGGMTYDETAAALNISAATVERELRFGKAWLARELQQL